VLSYFTPEEILETLRRINKEAHFVSRRAYTARRVNLAQISIKTVKFFQRTEEI